MCIKEGDKGFIPTSTGEEDVAGAQNPASVGAKNLLPEEDEGPDTTGHS